MSKHEPTMTRSTMSVLSAIMGSSQELSGSELAAVTRLASGTLYPILIRLETAGWVTSEWEAGREYPRRRLYRITAVGESRVSRPARY